MSVPLRLTGHRTGRLVVLRQADKIGAGGKTFWQCRCECGNTVEIVGSRLRGPKPTMSCGCLRREVSAAACRSRATHNLGGTRIYNIWRKMTLRCTSPDDHAWPDYGERGIQVCAEWANDPAAFAEWAYSNGYATSLTIERIDNNGNYEPSNCRWATRNEQARNKRNNFNVQVGGASMCATDWQKVTGVCRKVIANRIRAGIPPELAVSTHGHAVRHLYNPTTTVREKVK